MGHDAFSAAIDRFRRACAAHPLVVAAFLGRSRAARRAHEGSDLDVYVITEPANYAAFVADRNRLMRSWGRPVRLEDVWNFEGLGFDMIVFEFIDGVWGELALATTTNFMSMHGGPHDTLVDKDGVLDGVSFPLL